jgi:membrane protease subunit HflK
LFGFRSEERDDVIRDTARVYVRAGVARNPVDLVLTQRGPIQDEIRVELQSRLDAFRAGVHVQSVQLQDVDPPAAVRDAFADVTSAAQDREARCSRRRATPTGRAAGAAARRRRSTRRARTQQRVLERRARSRVLVALVSTSARPP